MIQIANEKIIRKIRPSTHLSTKVLLSQYILVQQTRSILTFCLRNYGGTGWKIGAAPSPLIFLTGCRATLCLWQYDTKGPRCFGCSRPRQTQGIFGIMFKAEGVIWFRVVMGTILTYYGSISKYYYQYDFWRRHQCRWKSSTNLNGNARM